MSDSDPQDLDFDDDFDATVVTDSERLREELSDLTVRDQAYVVVLAGSDVGNIFKLEQGHTTLGRSPDAEIRLLDDSISRKHARLILTGMSIQVEDLDSSNGTYVNGDRVTRLALNDGDKIRVGDTTILKFSFHDQLDEDFQRHMYDAALRDGLTKAFNKRYFLDRLAKEIRFSRRHKTELCLCMIDIDHFKAVNDTYGHIAGDEVLVRLAELARRLVRSEDIFARYGGEEFAIIARGISMEQAGAMAERLRVAVAKHGFSVDGTQLDITISLGVAPLDDSMEEPSSLIDAADSALYAAKRGGRNRVLIKRPK